MSELDRLGNAAAAALVSETTYPETEAALAGVRAGGSAHRNPDRSRWPLLALVAAAAIVLVGGLVLIRRRDTGEVETPVATQPATVPVTTPLPTTPATAPATVAPTASSTPATQPATTVAVPTTEPATT